MSEEDDARITGSLFRGYVAGLDAMGLRASVRAAVSPPVQALIDHPPMHRDWLDGTQLVEVFKAVIAQRGLEGIRQLGYEATRASTLNHLRPMIQTAMSLHGATPAGVFGQLNAICKPFFRGLSFEYAPEGPRSGTVTLRTRKPMGTVEFAAWEGALRSLYDELRTPGGVVEPALIAPDKLSGRMKVRW
jgi:hypothetical protein